LLIGDLQIRRFDPWQECSTRTENQADDLYKETVWPQGNRASAWKERRIRDIKYFDGVCLVHQATVGRFDR
jgi:hypothetical protein